MANKSSKSQPERVESFDDAEAPFAPLSHPISQETQPAEKSPEVVSEQPKQEPEPRRPETFSLTSKASHALTINTSRRTVRVQPRASFELFPDEHLCPEIKGLQDAKQISLNKI